MTLFIYYSIALLNFFIANVYFLLFVLILSFLLIYLCKFGYMGAKLRNYVQYKHTGELFILLFIFSGVITCLSELTMLIMEYSLCACNTYNLEIVYIDGNTENISELKSVYKGGITEGNLPQDPVRWFPSGVGSLWGVLGSAVGVYRAFPGGPRAKSAAAVTSLGVSVPLTVFTYAVENPFGFNLLAHNWIHFLQTGSWPDPRVITNNPLAGADVQKLNEKLGEGDRKSVV